jgi:hypothetical protein
MLLQTLPQDLIRLLCGAYLTPHEATYLAFASQRLLWCRIIFDKTIWSLLFQRRFPQPSLLQLKETSAPSLERFRHRLTATRRALRMVAGEYLLCGETCDAGSGNVTPATSNLTLSSYSFHADVHISKGTLHNKECMGVWQRGFFGAARNEWTVSFEEILPTNAGKFVYEGILEKETGTILKGTFYWSVMPKRVCGTFRFQVQERRK